MFPPDSGCVFFPIVSGEVVSPTGWDNGSFFGRWYSDMIFRKLIVGGLSDGYVNMEVCLQRDSFRHLLCLLDCLICAHPRVSIWSWHKWFDFWDHGIQHRAMMAQRILVASPWHVRQHLTTSLLVWVVPHVHRIGLNIPRGCVVTPIQKRCELLLHHLHHLHAPCSPYWGGLFPFKFENPNHRFWKYWLS